ncbi:unnamed protein product [Jaminaea pallidilutea]
MTADRLAKGAAVIKVLSNLAANQEEKALTPVRRVFKACKATPEQWVKYILSRMPAPELLDAQNLGDIEQLARRRQDIDGRGVHAIGTYKMFLRYEVQGAKRTGSYSGLAAEQPIKKRIVNGHCRNLEKSISKRYMAAGTHQPALYRASTDLAFFFAATIAEASTEELARQFTAATGEAWPSEHLQLIHRITIALDEQFFCAAFNDLGGGYPGIETVPEELRWIRDFEPLNTALPRGTAGFDGDKCETNRVEHAELESRQERAALAKQEQRTQQAREALQHGLEATVSQGGALVVKVGSIQHAVEYSTGAASGHCRIRLVQNTLCTPANVGQQCRSKSVSRRIRRFDRRSAGTNQ